jgi:hypothetical protein
VKPLLAIKVKVDGGKLILVYSNVNDKGEYQSMHGIFLNDEEDCQSMHGTVLNEVGHCQAMHGTFFNDEGECQLMHGTFLFILVINDVQPTHREFALQYTINLLIEYSLSRSQVQQYTKRGNDSRMPLE